MRDRPSTYAASSWLFFRLLGLVYLVAFWSLGVQIRALIGHDGILPADSYLAAVRQYADAQHIGLERFRLLPTLCWLNASDTFLQVLCGAGIALGVLLLVGAAPIVVLPLLWIDYLSLSVVSREFLSYQWDALLLETGLLAVLLAPWTWWDPWRSPSDPPVVSRWLCWWLLFRLMFGSGVVKIASGDPLWRSLTALTVHYETQPIPTPVAWYAHHLPSWFQRASTASVLAIELAVPCLILAPRVLRRGAGVLLIAIQCVIALTGNYAFFNLLSIALCLLLFDDDVFARMGRRFQREEPIRLKPEATSALKPEATGALTPEASRSRRRWLAVAAAIVIVPVSAVTLGGQMGVEVPGSGLVAPLEALVAPFQSINAYGLFAVMTPTRPEIVVEGSNDGTTWREYEFKFKPGNLARRPPWVAPHQPRLDWQMWFAALGRYDQEDWFQRFCRRLLEGSPEVLGVLDRNPFADRPPRFIRSTLYRYRFADAETSRRNGIWWTREPLGPYSPTLSLGP